MIPLGPRFTVSSSAIRRANDASHATTASGWRRISSKSPRAAPSGSRSAAARAAASSASAFAFAASKSPALRLFLWRRPDADGVRRSRRR